ncbi:MAG: prolyl aminopeptidase [Ferrovum sp. 37-45-19]|uniref:prolyl aminopeptidase n=1 Tax=Ferrovum sp. JA12 TaxID=1356299 RepID=UPI0007037E67|nr:prolyl aminopeptidase [Ferrovum sp. JA12]OYV80206.1 MAG: prolyl aminopeptidase [Ferrovum sp. 21-44-67]OYV94483.1 MAG: prolyl aminopeptidase [Ferrovum sp. 37-45-19]OZB33894.1 MAG: prolyl aminopeptidase [Ferrovum sp. 34-44-207]HQT81619.1 prolyl aminopeptidase [Ferrovaceae bacterium]KRH78886.1 proline iminopeptidase [Ferrovum sp. JA12]
MQKYSLFPPIDPYQKGRLTVGDIHEIYWEQSGHPQGIPVVFLHGGPGAGAGPMHRQFFDPTVYRIIIFDQRGAGRSTPLGETRDNTTPLLIEDMEQLRRLLGINQWLIFGGSWGSTLALAYAQSHPDRCLGLILRGIFLCRKSEIDWFLYGIKTFFPEAWGELTALIPEHERGNLLEAYHRRLQDADPKIHLTAARKWSAFEGACSTLMPNPALVSHFGSDAVALGLARIEAHYFTHNIFLPDNSLLNNIDRIRHLPGIIVQGRYDAVCPIVTADELHRAWPEATYQIIADAGHSAFEPGILSALVAATENFKHYF